MTNGLIMRHTLHSQLTRTDCSLKWNQKKKNNNNKWICISIVLFVRSFLIVVVCFWFFIFFHDNFCLHFDCDQIRHQWLNWQQQNVLHAPCGQDRSLFEHAARTASGHALQISRSFASHTLLHRWEFPNHSEIDRGRGQFVRECQSVGDAEFTWEWLCQCTCTRTGLG